MPAQRLQHSQGQKGQLQLGCTMEVVREGAGWPTSRSAFRGPWNSACWERATSRWHHAAQARHYWAHSSWPSGLNCSPASARLGFRRNRFFSLLGHQRVPGQEVAGLGARANTARADAGATDAPAPAHQAGLRGRHVP